MICVKGQLVQLHPRELPFVERVVSRCQHPRLGPLRLFREAHMAVKKVVVRLSGEQVLDSKWELSADAIEKLPDTTIREMLASLRQLAICFDCLDNSEKQTISANVVYNLEALLATACGPLCFVLGPREPGAELSARREEEWNTGDRGARSCCTTRRRSRAPGGFGRG